MSGELEDIAAGYERDGAVHEALNSTPMVNSSLAHLTLSEKIMEFLEEEDITKTLVPLADQICATNWLDERGVALNKAMVDSAILHIKIFGNEDDHSGQARLRTARHYLHQLLDGCLKGYRGRLATEMRSTRRIETESLSPEKRRWRS